MTAVGLPLKAARTARQLRPARMTNLIALADIVAVLASFAAAISIRFLTAEDFPLHEYIPMWPVAALFVMAYAWFGLYPGIATYSARELRQLATCNSMVMGALAALVFLFRMEARFSRLTMGVAWVILLFLAPLARAAVRNMFGRRSWWGYPVIVFGSSAGAAQTVNELRRHPETGLRPVAVLTENGEEDEIEGVEVIGTHSQGPVYALNLGVHRAVIAMPEAHSSELSRLVEHSARLFTHVYVLTRLAGLSSLGVEIRDVGNMLALEFQRSLLVPSHQAVKRVIDVFASSALLLLLAPVMAGIALLIRREAKAPIFYAQNRLGRDGRTFRMWKFRSMLPDSAALLEELLRNDPAARAEWEANHKLRNDPRITALGSVLRKTSLDELPQLWNVLKGDMSLVGPRPIVNDEIVKYGEGYDFYKRVVPGLTGLWQVSGRSETTYDERVGLDIYYVRNWSPWLDVYLLARTVTVVLTGKGSY